MDRFHELKVFVTVAETGGFAKAAARLGNSPPAVTRVIAGLEQRLGAEFFARTTRRVHLTEAGKLFLERARSLLADLETAEFEVTGESRMPTGHLIVTASVTLGRSILPPIVTGFLNAHSRITAKVLLLDRVVNLIEEGVDVAVRIGELPTRRSSPAMWAMSSAYWSQAPAILPNVALPRRPPNLSCTRSSHSLG